MTDLNPGDAAPEIALPDQDGASVSLSDLRGAPVVVYFYPRDDTPGCTAQAKDFTAAAAEFEAIGARVLGISKDPVAKHVKFRAKHDLTVRLLSDEHGDVAERYGVWGEKKMYGKTFMGLERATFLIDAQGRIAKVWRKVKVPGHVDAVLTEARDLGN
ncbi:MAG: thioredoxin-dependent thiol peroxidase [Paracoccaceae bacterium]